MRKLAVRIRVLLFLKLFLKNRYISLFTVIFILFSESETTAASFYQKKDVHFPPPNMKMFEKCYPDLVFSHSYEADIDDWKITVTKPVKPGSKKTKTQDFYWADGRMLPKENLGEKDSYWSLLYQYDRHLKRPEDLTKEEIALMKEYGKTETQMNTAGSPMFFFDFLYDAYSEKIIEPHIIETKFLGCKTKIHERLLKKIQAVEARVNKAAKTDKAVKDFLSTLASTDAYFWRVIANTTRKSFHSYGIAIDCLPKRLYGKQTYWSWAKSKYGDDWMLTPFSDRWMPPPKIVSAFEAEGFVWGGKWDVWDTMHFEYHPELIKFNKILD